MLVIDTSKQFVHSIYFKICIDFKSEFRMNLLCSNSELFAFKSILYQGMTRLCEWNLNILIMHGTKQLYSSPTAVIFKTFKKFTTQIFTQIASYVHNKLLI